MRRTLVLDYLRKLASFLDESKAHLLEPLHIMEGCIVHHQYGFWLRPTAAMRKELLTKPSNTSLSVDP
jgi:hypothetical protein